MIARLASEFWRRRFFRFLVIGAVNTAFGYGMFAVAVLAGLHYAIAALLATALGVLFNFKTVGRIVFGSRDNALLFRFFGSYLVTYIVGVGTMRLLKCLGVHELLSAALLLLPSAALSYGLNRRWVFTGAPAMTSAPRRGPNRDVL